MPNQNKRTSFTPHVGKGGGEKKKCQMAPEARFRPVKNPNLKYDVEK